MSHDYTRTRVEAMVAKGADTPGSEKRENLLEAYKQARFSAALERTRRRVARAQRSPS